MPCAADAHPWRDPSPVRGARAEWHRATWRCVLRAVRAATAAGAAFERPLGVTV